MRRRRPWFLGSQHGLWVAVGGPPQNHRPLEEQVWGETAQSSVGTYET